MSHAVYISEEHYAQLETLANTRGQTLEQALAELLQDVLPVELGAPNAAQNGGVEDPELPFVGMLADPLIEPEPGWLDRHDEIIAEEALDSHADEV